MKTIFTLVIFCCISSYLNAQSSQYNMLNYSFGDKGKVSVALGDKGVSRTQSVLLQKDGKIITAGQLQSGLGVSVFLARFLTNGDIDTSFGNHGFIRWANSYYDLLYKAKLQSDGKVVAVILSGGKKYAIRFTSSGFDSSFGDNGFVHLAHDSHNLVIDNDDNIITGETYTDKGYLVCAAQRFKRNGEADNGFGTNNFASIPVYKYDGYVDIPCAINLDNNNNIVVGSTCYSTIDNISKAYFTLVRFTPGGVIDSSFNNSGLLVFRKLNYSSMLTSIAIQQDNKIIAGGYADEGYTPNSNFITARVKANGSIDSSFGNNGFTSTDFNINPNAYPKKEDVLSAVLIQPDGKIVAAGYSKKYLFGNSEFALCRYTIDGALDTSFGLHGKVRTKFTSGIDTRANDAIIQPDGKIILAGYNETDGGSGNGGDIAMARYFEEKRIAKQSDISNSIAEINNNSVSLYPNPAHNILRIGGLEANKQYDIRIINQNGVTVTSTQIIKSTSCNLNIQSLNSGIYFLSITSNKNTTTKKFVKE